eukprot:4859973-Prymnesium_polylepis.3
MGGVCSVAHAAVPSAGGRAGGGRVGCWPVGEVEASSGVAGRAQQDAGAARNPAPPKPEPGSLK